MTEPILIVPDIHEETDRLHKALTKYSHIPKRVFLGDFFDSFIDSWPRFTDTVTVVLGLCADERNTLLLGNHDVHYWWGGAFRCSGWYSEKHKYIKENITEAEWSRFKLYTWAGKYLCSHAGIHPHFFPRTQANKLPYFHEPWLRRLCKDAMLDAAMYKIHPLLGAGWARGGGQSKGGIIWLDWDREFEAFRGLNQIVGHTFQPDYKPKYKGDMVKSTNLCLDTGLRHVAIVDGDELVVEDI